MFLLLQLTYTDLRKFRILFGVIVRLCYTCGQIVIYCFFFRKYSLYQITISNQSMHNCFHFSCKILCNLEFIFFFVRVRPLVLAVKLWAKHHRINEAKNQTLSSYTLTLMVIHYLQSGTSPQVNKPQKKKDFKKSLYSQITFTSH